MNESLDPDGASDPGKTSLDLLLERVGWKRVALIVLGACVLVVPPVIWLSAGSSDESKKEQGPSEAEATAAGCQLHEFEYGVTNDPTSGKQYQREALFGSHPGLPRPGFQAGSRSPSLPTVLHTLSHQWLVVKYNDALTADDKTRLRAYAGGERPGIAVVPGGPDMNSGFAAIRWGHGLDCAAADGPAIAVLREFERLPAEFP